MNCPECGAPEAACEAQYHACLAKEFEDAGYGAVHHLTVATYMLQHSSHLTQEGWLFERNLLREFLIEKKSAAFIRKQNQDVVDSGERSWKIKDPDGLPKIGRRHWTRTVLDVRTENAEIYCEDVRAWAQAALRDAEQVDINE